ncbi:MAG TPA: peptidoglycan bridge formation glycyltransferase FemA/FemB family protein [Ktedonobacterales bacterium]|nr:peptidoglycan bridge formation glycyltransferase FemA/FemB family protein [Ktedonobacterales bacterium]
MELREVTEAAQWDALVADHAYGHPLQCWGWGEVKGRSGWRAHRLAVFEGDTFRAGAQVLTRLVPGMPLTMLYAPRGPVAAPDDATALRALAAGLRRHASRERAIFCKVDPAWPCGTSHALAGADFHPSASPVQVTETYTIDLTQPEDALLGAMRSKTRQYIRKAEREETEIVQDTSGEHLAVCYRMYEETARRAHFGLHPRAYYDDLFQHFPAARQHLYVAFRHGTALSFLWMVCAGRLAVEFYGGVADAGQEWKSNYLLKWHAIQHMKAAGYEVYDLNGRVNEGIAQFKQGFGPAETSWIGPFDAVYRPWLYRAWEGGLPLARRLLRRG